MREFTMPALGADMEAGTLVEWLKRPGDPLTRGDVIAVVDTDKGAIEIEVFEDGVLERTVVTPGERVPVGTVLALIRAEKEEAVPAGQARPSAPPAPVAAEAGAPPTGPPLTPATVVPAPAAPSARLRVSPVARALAADLRVDLAQVIGTGPGGAITREDVQNAATPAGQPTERTRRSPDMRAAIAAAMARSKREVPHYYLSTTIDLSHAVTWLRAENERRAITERLLPAVLLLKAVALALRAVPELNGSWVDGAFRPGTGIHLGWAIALRGGGLVAPALHDADKSELTDLMRRLQDLVARARAGSLRSSELADPTITVTNMGEQGVDSVFGIIYPPQVALVGFGRIGTRPWVAHERVEARPVVVASLSGDHRATDGHRGGLLLAAIDRLLQSPDKL